MMYSIKDKKLSTKGWERITWAGREMPVIENIAKRFKKQKPLAGVKLAACLHVTTETANLMLALKAGGAQVNLCASNPLSTQDDVAAALVVKAGIPVFAHHGADRHQYYKDLEGALALKPNYTMDDGADVVTLLHTKARNLLKHVRGGTEETTTGVIRLKSLAAEGKLAYPIIAVNDASTKHFFDNRYGTGQSTWDGILRATNMLIAGRIVVVAGYGWCGRGVAMRAKGLGARVLVAEVNPLTALEAVMDGFEVMPMREAAKFGQVFVSVTGNTSVISQELFKEMRHGTVVANAGHFDVEIDVAGLKKISKAHRQVRNVLDIYTLPSGKEIVLIGEGRLVNLAAAEGHPAMVMDMSFANQALSLEYLVKQGAKLAPQVYSVPREIDQDIARLKLESLGVRIDKLTKEQDTYLNSWTIGT